MRWGGVRNRIKNAGACFGRSWFHLRCKIAVLVKSNKEKLVTRDAGGKNVRILHFLRRGRVLYTNCPPPMFGQQKWIDRKHTKEEEKGRERKRKMGLLVSFSRCLSFCYSYSRQQNCSFFFFPHTTPISLASQIQKRRIYTQSNTGRGLHGACDAFHDFSDVGECGCMCVKTGKWTAKRKKCELHVWSTSILACPSCAILVLEILCFLLSSFALLCITLTYLYLHVIYLCIFSLCLTEVHSTFHLNLHLSSTPSSP